MAFQDDCMFVLSKYLQFIDINYLNRIIIKDSVVGAITKFEGPRSE